MRHGNPFLRGSLVAMVIGGLALGSGELAGRWARAQAESELSGNAHQLAGETLARLERGFSGSLVGLYRQSADPAFLAAMQRFERSGDYRAQLRMNAALQQEAARMPWSGHVDVRDPDGRIIASSSTDRIGRADAATEWQAPTDLVPGATLRHADRQLTLRVPWERAGKSLGVLDYTLAMVGLAGALHPLADHAATGDGVRARVELVREDGTTRLARTRTGSADRWRAGELAAQLRSDHLPLRVTLELPRQAALQAQARFRDAGLLGGMLAFAVALVCMLLYALSPYLHGIRLLRHLRPRTTEVSEPVDPPAGNADSTGHTPSERMAYDILATHHVLEEVLREHTGELEKLYRVLNQEHRKRDAAETALRAAEARFHEAVESCMEGVWEWRAGEGLRSWIAESFLVTLGLRRNEFAGGFRELLEMMHPGDREACFQVFQQQVRFGSHFEIEYRLQTRGGDWRWFASRGQAIRNEAKTVVRITGCIQDIQARKRAELEVERLLQELERRAHRDELTGLHNRTSFLELARSELKRADRSTQPLSLLMLDLDHFKQINDRHGHAAGDRVLRTFARLLQDQVRESDACGRIGGEEFVVLLPETSLRHARQLAERVRQAIAAEQLEFDSGRRARITCSIGVARLLPGESLETFMARTDELLYKAKHAGRDRVCHEADGSTVVRAGGA